MSKQEEKTSEVTQDLTGLIITSEDVLKPVLLNIENINDGTFYDKGYAYCVYPYYYIYRGTTMTVEFSQKLPGLYLTPDDHYIFIPVTPGNEDDQWKIEDKFATADQKSIIDVMIATNDVQLSIPDSGKVFRPDECETDDALKRAVKRVLKNKGIDIDQYKARFADKNALFNFKQVIKNPDARLSMLLFERGCSALNLKYTITVEEINEDDSIGNRLDIPVSICSEDTYNI